MRLLAIESATPEASVALLDNGELRGHATASVGPGHAERMMAMVADVLGQAGIAIHDVDCFVAGIGPGSFTGVRVALSTIKGLGLAVGKKVMGVSSLQALAAEGADDSLPVAVVLDARRTELFAAIRDTRAQRWIMEPAVGSVQSVGSAMANALAAIDRTTLTAIGDLTADAWSALRGAMGASATVAACVRGIPRAEYVAREALCGRAILDTGMLEPTYVRACDAKLPAIRQRGTAP